MLDTNILIDFFLIQQKEEEKQEITDALRKSKELRDGHLQKKFEIYASEWNLLEFRDVLEKLTEEKKLILNGYALHEFSEGRKALPLTTEEISLINESVDVVRKGSKCKTSETDLKKLNEICEKGVSTFDALLLMQANSFKDCDFFITRDARLIKTFNEKLKEILPNIKVIGRSESIRQIQTPG